MIKVVVIGSGNVAQHLIKAFAKNDNVSLIQVFSRDKEDLMLLLDSHKITTDFSSLFEADLYIIAVSDHAINEVSTKIPFTNKLVVHTSGSVSINELSSKNRKGVFYPLQTFSKSKAVDFRDVPMCLETEFDYDYKILETLAKSIADKVYPIKTDQRKSLHVAAVFVSNFVNHMYVLGNDICTQHNIPFDILKPLILETAQKTKTLLPIDAQTGPASRNDTQTIQSHLQFLDDENIKEIYKILTKSIIDHGKKL